MIPFALILSFILGFLAGRYRPRLRVRRQLTFQEWKRQMNSIGRAIRMVPCLRRWIAGNQ